VRGSFARGEVFQANATGESPISGTLASLCGVEAALSSGSTEDLDLALRRLESLYSVVFSFGGIPLIYSGDELALLNGPPAPRDNRWIHRVAMDWAAVGDRDTVPGRAHAALRGLAAARATQPPLGGGAATTVLDADRQLLTYLRGTPGQRLVLAVVNVGTTPTSFDLTAAGIRRPVHIHSTAGSLDAVDGRIEVPGCGFCWVGDDSHEH
jgi:amylosucrase